VASGLLCYGYKIMGNKYTKEMFAPLAEKANSYLGLARMCGLKSEGSASRSIKRVTARLGIDTTHFLGRKLGTMACARNRLKPEQRLVSRPIGSDRANAAVLRRALLAIGRKHECELCGLLPKWNGGKLVLQIDHKNRNSVDDRAENLRFLCPNCHSQC